MSKAIRQPEQPRVYVEDAHLVVVVGDFAYVSKDEDEFYRAVHVPSAVVAIARQVSAA